MQLVSLSHICPCLSTPAPSRSPSRHPCRSGAHVVKGIKAKLEHLWAYAPERHPAAYLTKSFNPQRALRNTGLRLTRSAAKDFLLDRLSKRGRRPHLKTGPRWRTKRAVMRRIRSLKRLRPLPGIQLLAVLRQSFSHVSTCGTQRLRRHWPRCSLWAQLFVP